MSPELFGSPLSVEVGLQGTVLGLFPIGDAPSAGFAQLADRLADEVPNVVRAPDVASLLAALDGAGGTLRTIELGAIEYDIGDLVLPPRVQLRGQGRGYTNLNGRVKMGPGSRLQSLRIFDSTGVGVTVEGNGEEVLLRDVIIDSQGTSASGLTVSGTDAVVIDDSIIRVIGGNDANAIIVDAGNALRVTNSRVESRASAVARGIVAAVGAFKITFKGVTLVTDGDISFGFELFGGVVVVTDSNLRSTGAESRPFSSGGAGDYRVSTSTLAGDLVAFIGGTGSLKIANSGLESFSGNGAAGTTCLFSYDVNTNLPLGTNCLP